jgi:hypothetical protein
MMNGLRQHYPTSPTKSPRVSSVMNPESPRTHRLPSMKQHRERVPFKYIEIDSEQGDVRDYEEILEINKLVDLIDKRDWDVVAKHIRTPQGMTEATIVLPTFDYALHLLCQCGSDVKVPKYGPVLRNASLSSFSCSSATTDSRTTESGSKSKSIDSHEKEDSQPESCYPPKSVMLAVLEAHREAVKVIGAEGSLPLHYAVRKRYPMELLLILLRAYPQALDMRDGGMRTPRDYVPIMEDTTARSAFLRPTSCWLQHLHDEELQKVMENELLELEQEVGSLMSAMESSREDEATLRASVFQMEQELQAFGDLENCIEFNQKEKEIQTTLTSEIEVIREKIESLVGQSLMKYNSEEKERSLLTAFNDDVIKIYNNVYDGMAELRDDIEKVKQFHMETSPV